MILSDSQVLIRVLIMAGITFLLRILPFLLFPAGKPTPNYVLYLGKVLPFAIIGMLVIYCLKEVILSAALPPYCLPELIAIAVTVLLHIWKRNSLLSIGGGTILYMVLVQTVFA